MSYMHCFGKKEQSINICICWEKNILVLFIPSGDCFGENTMSEEEEVPLMKSERAGSQKSSCDSALQVHLYYSPCLNSETTFNIPTIHITAESVCMLAAKASGETCLRWLIMMPVFSRSKASVFKYILFSLFYLLPL